MTLLKALTALLLAATAYLERWHLWKLAELDAEIDQIHDEIITFGKRGDPADQLQIDALAAKLKRLRALRSTLNHPNKRD